MAFIADLADYLNHLAVVSTISKDGFGAQIATGATTLTCFAYFGELDRSTEGQGVYSAPVGWKIIFGTDARTLLVIGNLVSGVTDQDGLTVISTAEITKVIPYRHWDEGLDFLEVELKLN